MRGRSPPGRSPPPRRSHGGGGGGSRRRSPSPRGGRGGYGRDSTEPSSLLVRNIPRDCSAEDLRIPFERYGVVKDVYLPRDYYTGYVFPRSLCGINLLDIFSYFNSGLDLIKLTCAENDFSTKNGTHHVVVGRGWPI
ncbi:hypothetical protein M758_6G118700 [Ceratodon purpureus]|nr:hypothetical protein M758_6G118700 [Ceratodon purpureus]